MSVLARFLEDIPQDSISDSVRDYIGKISSLNEYSVAALRTRAPHNDLTCAALGLAGESSELMRACTGAMVFAGQFADGVKKHTHHKHDLDKLKAAKEIGDVMWYCALAADQLGMTLEEVCQLNITKLAIRFPDGFTVERSKHNGT